MPRTFAELYKGLLKEVFLTRAREDLAQGSDALTCADAYAEQGKPDFVLAYLWLLEGEDEAKRDIFARSFERRAEISEEKATQFSQQFHRSFPMIHMEAQKDRLSAQQIRQGRQVRREKKALPLNLN